VCGKEGCWSTRHTQEECDQSKKRFDNWINQFILEYKGEEAEKSPNELIKAFIIDFDLDTQEQETSEIFLTTFKLFTDSQAFNIIIVLANYSFVHLIAPEN